MKQDVKKVLLLGSGALKIGEAGEFDYSGTQALKALREEGIATVLINPNIATVQTSEGMADKIYFLPVTPFFVEKVIEKENPDGILLSFGGQTALNCGVALHQSGILKKHGVRVLGTPVSAILDTEDRELFTRKLDEIHVKTPRSIAVTGVDEAVQAAATLGYPVIVRSAFALGGLGSGFCGSEDEMRALTQKSFSYSSQVLVEESLKGWKEVEYEVVRDGFDNCITVCNMENFDPLGIHTGESIVVAPSQTLSNREYHKLRELSIRIVRHIGIVGECNVQYALDPGSEDYRVIEVNARLSRSSALASKATGYPLAFVAAKIALGYGLFELKNSVTQDTSAFFEPALDYIVVKIPRWDLGKFHGVSREIGSSMKSVGEVMAIGRTFEEAIQKGLRMIGQGMHGFVGNKDIEDIIIDQELAVPTDMRIFVIAMALMKSYSVERIFELTKIDRWFLEKLKNIWDTRNEVISYNTLEELPLPLLQRSKQLGFSDFQLARFIFKSDRSHITDDLLKVRDYRKKIGIVPCVKQIDTMAAEYPARTNYLYLTYNGNEHDIGFPEKSITAPTTKAVGSGNIQKMEPTASVVGLQTEEFLKNEPTASVVVLGSGAYRIGSSVEFDWCGVNALECVNREGYRSVMINYNPETVSTDYDLCDRLYFEELTFERVMDILDLENPLGVIVSTGGQIPNNLAMRLREQEVAILGTSPQSIDKAENRHKFSAILDELGIDQPRWIESSSVSEVYRFTDEVGFPVIVRPSYVLSGAAMNIVSNRSELEHFLEMAAEVSKQYPVVVSRFIEDAKEIEMDAVAANGEIICYAISEHVEFAGVHSGDATMLFPPQKIYVETVRRIKRISRQIAEHLKISGPFNIQFLAKDNDVMVIECNLRASRSFPFISKVLKTNFIEIATKIMLGKTVAKPDKSLFDLDYVGVKASQFSFSRLQKADPVLGVEMVSTGEVGCIGDNYYEAILKSMLSVGYTIPEKAVLFSSGPSRSKQELLTSARMLQEKGLTIYATGGTHDFFIKNGIDSVMLHWPGEDKTPNTMEYLRRKKIDLVINIPKDLSKSELDNDYRIRRSAVDFNIPLITNARLASAFIYSFCKIGIDEIGIKAWEEYE
ncbi:MAG: carbamoyl-phosphate synthase large subunit [Bacteroidales bacterium]|jgi:carbamoyl-phosphate synthase large subunit|nr:carbamoyl-phosphate synthase large subunit [Bacteroidales bacterium]